MKQSETIKDYSVEGRLEVYESMLVALPQSMFLMDRNKIIIGIFNAAEQTLAGFSVDEIVGNSILLYANDPNSPFHQACSMLNSTFDPVFSTGIPLKFQYMILDSFFEATITKISGERILSQVQDITSIILKQNEVEAKKHKELMMALTAGGLTSWSYDVQSGIITSTQPNNVIESSLGLDDLLSRIAPSHHDNALTMFNNIISEGSTHQQVTLYMKDLTGKMIWCDVHAIPHEYDENGLVKVIVGSQKDVTETHSYNERLEKLIKQNELILNNNNSGFAYINSEMVVEWENVSSSYSDPEILSMFSHIAGETTRCTINSEKLCKIVKKASIAKSPIRDKYITLNGLVFEITTQPILKRHDEIEGIVLRLDNITDKERNMQELAQAKERAEQADRLKSAFLANMSHEIRTPLNSIVGFAQLIHEASSEEERQDYVNIINTNSEMLLKLINDILDLSKIEAGYLEYHNETFDLVSLFKELELMFKHKVASGVRLFAELPAQSFTVEMDRLRISQVISNFITNAIKFTKAGHIKIGFDIIPKGVRLFVEDTGCGMSEEEVNKVFNRFEKFNAFKQGNGLGTAIAKAIVSAYNGEIGVQSEKDKGSTFWAILPVSHNQDCKFKAKEIQKNAMVSAEIDLSNVRVLVAEDNDSNYLLVTKLLKDYQLTRACNGAEAVELAKTNSFDLILMDVRMPVMDGIEAIKEIRQFNPNILIIALTANAYNEDRAQCLEVGANDFITKPVNKTKLNSLIEEYMNGDKVVMMYTT